MVQTAQIGRKLAHKRVRKHIENAAVKPLLTDTQEMALPMTGAQAVAYWQALPGGSVYANVAKHPGTSQEVARRLREQEEARTRREP